MVDTTTAVDGIVFRKATSVYEARGIFVEGAVNHQIMGIHHVSNDLGGPLSCDLGYLAFGALLILRGLAVVSQPED